MSWPSSRIWPPREPAAVARVAERRKPDRRLAGARFADQAQHLAALQLDVDALDDRQPGFLVLAPALDLEALHLEQHVILVPRGPGPGHSLTPTQAAPKTIHDPLECGQAKIAGARTCGSYPTSIAVGFSSNSIAPSPFPFHNGRYGMGGLPAVENLTRFAASHSCPNRYERLGKTENPFSDELSVGE